ncbi:HypC/HybG/HupF family hydrogenase formation chaperone [Clostridium cellulovorans]|uniref:Hydrogenase assembly chaperone hypC/hupF n=1 Tax=Clostridium cellulovorans (strain ATCC 35296 / DSM 3052 / OCM 3 / 743B) TaxID=573061 RepID=D9SUL1_CLOC7|nr:HypC/HybG/HupF family hydrogenase formation chaperone [Clostridium cellulovorans]ADL50916.1 hydrogenase assembly chaperone hypC/hupF [Clostridium cellulovorans 743B]
MCIAVPLEVIEVYKEDALVQYNGVKMKVNILLLEDVKVGDYLLIHAGCAIEKLDKVQGKKTQELFKKLFEGSFFSEGHL